MLVANIISVAVLLVTLEITGTNAECCPPIVINHICSGDAYEQKIFRLVPEKDQTNYWIRESNDRSKPKCSTSFCGDGVAIAAGQLYCGKGKCDSIGCNCVGGCRKGENLTEEGIIKTFVNKYGFKKQAKDALAA